MRKRGVSKIKSIYGQFWRQLTTLFPDRQLGVKRQQEYTNSQPHPAFHHSPRPHCTPHRRTSQWCVRGVGGVGGLTHRWKIFAYGKPGIYVSIYVCMSAVWQTHTHMCVAGRKALCSWPAVMHVNVGHLKSYKHSPTQIPFLFLLLLHHSMRFSPASFSAINWQPADADVFQICTVPFATHTPTHTNTQKYFYHVFFWVHVH